MPSIAEALVLTVSLTVSAAGPEKPDLPRAIVEEGLARAGCTVPASRARIVGTEVLGPQLQIVEMTCAAGPHGIRSVLFGVPHGLAGQARLLPLEGWDRGRIRPIYSVPSPGYDRKTRTLSATDSRRESGDCGVIQEWKWTGWHFRLLHAWSKDRCDGLPFEWDTREGWQVFPAPAAGPGHG